MKGINLVKKYLQEEKNQRLVSYKSAVSKLRPWFSSWFTFTAPCYSEKDALLEILFAELFNILTLL